MDFIKRETTLILFFFLCQIPLAFSQKMITVKGTVTDSQTGEAIGFGSVRFVGTDVGDITDFDGTYVLNTKFGSDSLEFSYLGYVTQVVPIIKDKISQRIDIELEPEVHNLNDVVVKSKKKVKYKRKTDPGMLLWKKVMKNKDKNRMEAQSFYEYNKYEKVELDINNLTSKFRQRKALKKFQFLFDYVDTSEVNGKPYLPIYIRETASKVYYRLNPRSKKEHREGIKVSGLDDFMDDEGFSTVTDLLYRDIDIYKDKILLFDKQFMSPLSPLANPFYRFYLLDSMEMKGQKVYQLAVTPVSKSDVGFKGDLFVTADENYAVIKADLGMTKHANVNFVNDLRLIQEFDLIDSVWTLTKDQILIDFSPIKKSMGFYASRSVLYNNHIFNAKRKSSFYEGTENVKEIGNVYEKDREFWDSTRQEKLTKTEEGVYEMIDTLQKVPVFRTVMDALSLVVSGYLEAGPVDIGAFGAFYSFNEVEGFRLRFGGTTNLHFHPKLQFEGYGAYGFRDKEWKYAASVRYSFQENFKKNPQHYIRLSHLHETKFVGHKLKFVQEDDFFLSFRRGSSSKMLLIDRWLGEYFYELNNSLNFRLGYSHTLHRPIGSLEFNLYDPVIKEERNLSQLTTSEIDFKIKFAPNQQFIQSRNFRKPIINKYPVFELSYKGGFKNLFGGDYNYHHLNFHIYKRFYLSVFGNTRFEGDIGKIWGDGIPYFLLYLPRANQSYIYRTGAFNMMNFMEFSSDTYALWIFEHFFEGFFFNRVPLLKKLKLREVISFKGVYGGLRDENDPKKNPELIQYLTDDDGKYLTSSLEEKPYLEASIGVTNIFKFFRVDMVRRLTYLENPDIPNMFGIKGMGMRIKMQIEF